VIKLIIPTDVGTALAALAEKERLNPEAMAYRLLREGFQARGLWPEEMPK
jgi:hypothetical protein